MTAAKSEPDAARIRANFERPLSLAKRELERQEQCRSRRPLDPTTPSSACSTGRASSDTRVSSAPQKTSGTQRSSQRNFPMFHPNSRPGSPRKSQPSSASRRVSPTTSGRSASGARRVASLTRRHSGQGARFNGPPKQPEEDPLRASFMISPARRFEDAQEQLQLSSAEERQALQEELESWYFGAQGGVEADFAALFAKSHERSAQREDLASGDAPKEVAVGPPSSPDGCCPKPALGALQDAAASFCAGTPVSVPEPHPGASGRTSLGHRRSRPNIPRPGQM
mmetsp:Transcript_34255/g.91460  ORF Transcript_34255/g.91460 Transcript_34255/m.91460 type:complete len:282 (-) Transcript_34255:122-967(-)